MFDCLLVLFLACLLAFVLTCFLVCFNPCFICVCLVCGFVFIAGCSFFLLLASLLACLMACVIACFPSFLFAFWSALCLACLLAYFLSVLLAFAVFLAVFVYLSLVVLLPCWLFYFLYCLPCLLSCLLSCFFSGMVASASASSGARAVDPSFSCIRINFRYLFGLGGSRVGCGCFILFRTGSMDEDSFIQLPAKCQERRYGWILHAQEGVTNAACGPSPRSTDSTHDPNSTGRLEVMVRVSPQGHTKNTDRQTSSPS